MVLRCRHVIAKAPEFADHPILTHGASHPTSSKVGTFATQQTTVVLWSTGPNTGEKPKTPGTYMRSKGLPGLGSQTVYVSQPTTSQPPLVNQLSRFLYHTTGTLKHERPTLIALLFETTRWPKVADWCCLPT